MRRKDKEITDRIMMESIIKDSKVCRLGLSDNNIPYIVPMCFGYDKDCIYMHCAGEGKKIDIMKKNNKVCLEFDTNLGLVESENACKWDMHYKSVIAFGEATFVTDIEEKKKGLNVLMKQYSDKTFEFPLPMVQNVTVLKIKIIEMTGKQSVQK